MTKILLISPIVGGQSGVGQHVRSLSKNLIAAGYTVETRSTENTFYINIKRLRNPSFAFFSWLKTKGAEYDLIHAHNIPSAFPMRSIKGKKVLTVHGYYSEQISLLHGRIIGKVARFIEPRILKWADVVTVVSKSAQEVYQKVGVETIHIPNAIDLREMPRGEERMFSPQIIFVGRLSREKGIDVLIEAMHEIEDAHLIIVGSGPERVSLDACTKKKIHMMGEQPWERTIRLIRGSDVLVLPSRIEGMPTVILEAMAVETPVIATEVGGIPEIIEMNREGVLVPKNDVKSITNAIYSVIEDRKLRNYLAKNAKEKVQLEYTWDVVKEKYLKIYEILFESAGLKSD